MESVAREEVIDDDVLMLRWGVCVFAAVQVVVVLYMGREKVGEMKLQVHVRRAWEHLLLEEDFMILAVDWVGSGGERSIDRALEGVLGARECRGGSFSTCWVVR